MYKAQSSILMQVWFIYSLGLGVLFENNLNQIFWRVTRYFSIVIKSHSAAALIRELGIELPNLKVDLTTVVVNKQ